MNSFKLAPMGAALLGLALISAAPASARAGEEEWNKGRPTIIRLTQDDDRDNVRDNVSDSSDDSGYLGVQVQRLSSALRRAKGIPESTEGTLVTSVEDGSPADEAGIKRGDVILQVNRQDTPNPNDLIRVVRGLDPGRRAAVQVWRDGVTRTYNLTVGTRPAMPEMPTPPTWGGPDRGDRDRDRDREMRDRDMPDGSRMQILRRNREDLDRQIRDLQAQVTRLEAEIRELQQQLNRRDRDNDRYRGDDRDRDHNEDD